MLIIIPQRYGGETLCANKKVCSITCLNKKAKKATIQVWQSFRQDTTRVTSGGL